MSDDIDGHQPGTWQITATSIEPGWLAIPADQDADAAADWITKNTAILREQWGADWAADADQVIPAMLAAGLEHRGQDDFLAFQLWVGRRPMCAFVHVVMGRRGPDDALPGPGDGILLDTEGLGPGVLVPRREPIGDADAVGFDVVFAFGEDVVVIVSVEPTFSDVLGLLSPSIQLLIQSLRVTGPDGADRIAMTPALLEAQPMNAWVDSLSAP